MAPNASLLGFATRAIHAGQDADPATGATVVPIYATSTYTQDAPGQHKGYEYSRSGNPTRTALETCLAALEEGERGLAFASGLAATTAVLSPCGPATRWPPRRIFMAAPSGCWNACSSRGAWSRATPTIRAPRASPASLRPKTKLVWIETPTNPLLQIVDIAAIAELAHKAKAVLAVDNTFASPYLQQPIGLGADLVVHSTTKYLGGHSDVVGGAVIGKRRVLWSRSRSTRTPPEPCRARSTPG